MGSLCLGLGVSKAIRRAIMGGVGVLTAQLSWRMINVYVNSNNSLAETKNNFDTNWMKNGPINKTDLEGLHQPTRHLLIAGWTKTLSCRVTRFLRVLRGSQTIRDRLTDLVPVLTVFIF